MVSVIYLRVTVAAGGCGGNTSEIRGRRDITNGKKRNREKMIREKPEQNARRCFH